MGYELRPSNRMPCMPDSPDRFHTTSTPEPFSIRQSSTTDPHRLLYSQPQPPIPVQLLCITFNPRFPAYNINYWSLLIDMRDETVVLCFL